MNAQKSEDTQTECWIYVEDWETSDTGGPVQGKQIGKNEFLNTVRFTYSNDVLNLGDPINFQIANPAGRYNKLFQRGSLVRMKLRNPNAASGQWTLKHEGIVTNRVLRCDMSGSYLEITSCDRGWHLRENDAPLWFRLQHGTFEGLLKNGKFIDSSWGIKGVVTDNETTGLIRQAKNQSRAQVAIDLQTMGTTIYLQVEPGDKVADLVSMYCRRIGRLFTVSPDGYIQIWTPSETAKPLYSINFHGFDSSQRTLNTVLSCNISEDITSIYTIVTCIGERVGGEVARDTTDQNATKEDGTFRNTFALPFRHNVNFTDGDIFATSTARKQARWKYNRGIFDSWTGTYVVRGHHCNGSWWEADTYVTVHDSVNGLDGDYYIQSVVYERDERGDRTTLTLRKPYLLKASFGVFPRAPRYSAPTVLPTAGVETVSSTKVTKTESPTRGGGRSIAP